MRVKLAVCEWARTGKTLQALAGREDVAGYISLGSARRPTGCGAAAATCCFGSIGGLGKSLSVGCHARQ